MSEARTVAEAYSPAASWVPVERVLPPEGETVEVLYADGVVDLARRAGRLFVDRRGGWRYVEARFWRPL